MDAYTTEARVRAQFNLHSTDRLSAESIETAIADAHLAIARVLDPVVDVSGPTVDHLPPGLVHGATLLAGARLFEALAAAEAFDQQRVALGPQRIEESTRRRDLMAAAGVAEARAWRALEPFVTQPPAREDAAVTASQAVLGEG